MALAVSNVVTSAPSGWGATNAACAAVMCPPFALVAAPLAALVSDPAQMWHAAERYGAVAEQIRTASTQITQAVAKHAGAEHWSEKGKDAFVSNRVRPYQHNLAQAAEMYDHIRQTLKRCAEAFTGAGLVSAVVGSTVLVAVTSMMELAPVPGANVAAATAANEVLAEMQAVIKPLVTGLTKIIKYARLILGQLAKLFNVELMPALSVAVGIDALPSGFYIGGRVAPNLADARATALGWPRQLPPGATPPAGYRAPSAADKAAIKKIRPESIKALGRDLDTGAGATLSDAYEQASRNDVGYPGFGLLATALGHAHTTTRDHAAQQLAACRDAPGTWLPGLRTTADNWIFAEQANGKAVRHGD